MILVKKRKNKFQQFSEQCESRLKCFSINPFYFRTHNSTQHIWKKGRVQLCPFSGMTKMTRRMPWSPTTNYSRCVVCLFVRHVDRVCSWTAPFWRVNHPHLLKKKRFMSLIRSTFFLWFQLFQKMITFIYRMFKIF